MKKVCGILVLLVILFSFVCASYAEYYLETWYKIKVYGKHYANWKYHVFNVQKETAVKAIQYVLKNAKRKGWSEIRVERLERYVKEIGRTGRTGMPEEVPR